MVILCKNRQLDNSKVLTLLNFDIVCINFDDIISFYSDNIIPFTAKRDIILKWHFRHYYSHPSNVYNKYDHINLLTIFNKVLAML